MLSQKISCKGIEHAGEGDWLRDIPIFAVIDDVVCGLTILKVTGANRSAVDEMQNEKGAPGRGGKKKKISHTQDKKCAGRKRCLNKNDAYDSPASARSSARSRSASTMANLRATCYKRYIHTRFLTCIPFLLFGDLAASEKFGGGETTRHWRLVIVINAIGRVMGLDSVFMRSKSADELIKI